MPGLNLDRLLGGRISHRPGHAETSRWEVLRDMYCGLGCRLLLPCSHTELWRCDSATLHSWHASSMCIAGPHTPDISGALPTEQHLLIDQSANVRLLVVHQTRTERSHCSVDFLQWFRAGNRGPCGVWNFQGNSALPILDFRMESGFLGIWMPHDALRSPRAHFCARQST